MTHKVISKKNQIRSIILITTLMIVTIAAILRGYTIGELYRTIQNSNPFFLISGIGMMLLFTGCQGMNFYIIMKTLGHPSPYKHCLEYAYVGNYFGAITPGASGGQPAQVYYMNKDKIPVDIGGITIFFMVFTSQIVILLIGGCLIIFRNQMMSELPAWVILLLIAGAIVMLSLTGILSALMFSRRTIPFLLRHSFRIGLNLHIIKRAGEMRIKLEELLASYAEKAKRMRKHPELFLKVFLITLLQWMAYCTVSYLVYLSFGHSEYTLIDLMTGQAIINIGVAAAPLPGSVGVAEKAFLTVFGQFYPEQELTSAMILSRIINFYLQLLLSFTVYLFVHFRIMRLENHHKGNNKNDI